jgi:hypothetical protein
MRVQKQVPVQVNRLNPTVQYRQGPILTNGALEFVYQKPVAWPLYTLWGIGILVREQLNVLQAPQLRADLALTKAPIVGAGYPASSTEFEALLAQSAEDENG